MGRRKATFEEFVAKARERHGARFEYIDDGSFDCMSSFVLIRCAEHGEFVQKAHAHTNGCGCPRCGKELVRQNLKSGSRPSRRSAEPPALPPFGALGDLYSLPFWN